MLHSEITDKILKAYYKVYNTLGYGFLEKVYENAMIIELEKQDLVAVKQKPIKVYYIGEVVGEYFADIIVENKIILELKLVEVFKEEHENQLLNYLKATDVEVGLLLNFGKTTQIKRKIFENQFKVKSDWNIKDE